MSLVFRHLLVPLDGSPLAEAALPAARHLAETLGAHITLLHMIESNAPRTVHGQPHLATPRNAETYLAELAERTLPGVSAVERHVHTSGIDDVAHSIVSHADELDIDLIVLCMHGAGGLRHAVFGTVAQRVIALGTTPVLLVPARRDDDAGFSCRRLMVPLDGNADHEQGLEAVAKLGPDCGEHVRLLMVIRTRRDVQQTHLITSRLLPGTTVELLEASKDPAQSYLDSKMKGMKNAHVSTAIVRGEPVRAIQAAARDFGADLIVLGTHGTTHFEAFWSGSLTPRLARRCHLPILLVPVGGASAR